MSAEPNTDAANKAAIHRTPHHPLPFTGEGLVVRLRMCAVDECHDDKWLEAVMNQSADEIERLERELAEARSEVSRLNNRINNLLVPLKNKLIEERDESRDAYDNLSGLLRMRFPMKDGVMPDFKIEDVLTENTQLKLDLGSLHGRIALFAQKWWFIENNLSTDETFSQMEQQIATAANDYLILQAARDDAKMLCDQLRADVERWQSVAETASAEREHNANVAGELRAEVKRLDNLRVSAEQYATEFRTERDQLRAELASVESAALCYRETTNQNGLLRADLARAIRLSGEKDSELISLRAVAQTRLEQVEALQVTDKHTCSEHCDRPLCVARRKIAELEAQINQVLTDEEYIGGVWYWLRKHDAALATIAALEADRARLMVIFEKADHWLSNSEDGYSGIGGADYGPDRKLYDDTKAALNHPGSKEADSTDGVKEDSR